MKNTKHYVIGEFHNTGINEVDVDLVVKDWGHLWHLTQYGAEFKLWRDIRKDSEEAGLKTEISAEQAGKLIEKLGLGAKTDYMFRKALSWIEKESSL